MIRNGASGRSTCDLADGIAPAPGGTFVVGFEDGVAVCCGAIKPLPGGACEIKRMFVAPAARGRGVARALLFELERRARELGYAVARLDTGPAAAARAADVRAGPATCRSRTSTPTRLASFFGEKRL